MLNLFFKFRFITRFIRVLSPFADSGSGIRVLSPFADSGSGIRVLSSFADSGSGIRVLSSFADSGSGIRVLSPFADSGSGIRVLSPFADSGSGIRVLSPFADSASGIRFRYSVPHSGSVSAFYSDPMILNRLKHTTVIIHYVYLMFCSISNLVCTISFFKSLKFSY